MTTRLNDPDPVFAVIQEEALRRISGIPFLDRPASPLGSAAVRGSPFGDRPVSPLGSAAVRGSPFGDRHPGQRAFRIADEIARNSAARLSRACPDPRAADREEESARVYPWVLRRDAGAWAVDMNGVLIGAAIFVAGFAIGSFGFGYGLASMDRAPLPSEAALLKILAPGLATGIIAVFCGAWFGLR